MQNRKNKVNGKKDGTETIEIITWNERKWSIEIQSLLLSKKKKISKIIIKKK